MVSRCRRVLAGLTIVLLAAVLVQVVRAAPVRGQPRPGHPSATQQARQTGHRVLIPSLTTGTGETYAEPDGSFTLEEHAEPVRVRRGSGWVPVDTRLAVSGAGVVPRAVSVPLVFSGGDAVPLARIGDGADQVTLSWPARLPKPAVSGDTATYHDVLPGVDLRMTARAAGFSEVLVVRDRAAGRDPRLAALRFGVTTGSGLTARSAPGGGLSFVDKNGRVRFQSPAPRMWDGARAHQATSRFSVGNGSVTVVPSQRLLADPATRYPVEIDPDLTAGQTGWAEVYAQHPNESYWGGDGDPVAKVGYSSWDVPAVTVRSYFQYSLAPLAGKDILSAEFNAHENHAPSCQARQVDMWETGPISGGTTWNAEPAWIRVLGSATVAYGYNASCPPGNIGADAKAAVVDGLNNGSQLATVMLKATDEGDTFAWKKFDTNPTLIVHYNSRPAVPTGLSTSFKDSTNTSRGGACAATPNQTYLGTATPTVHATVSDPDGGTVTAHFQWKATGGAVIGQATTPAQASGTSFGVPIPASAFTGQPNISWQVQGYDGTDYGPWSPWCDVTLDTTAPNTPPAVTSTAYPEGTWGGSVGLTGAFTFGANGVPDVAGYRYDLIDPPARYVAASTVGGGVTVGVTPPSFGPKDLYVRSVDRAGNLGPIYDYHFLVSAGTPPVGVWHLDGNSTGTAVPDSSGGGHPGTVTAMPGTARWTTGRVGEALLFNGSSGYVTTSGGPVVDTAKSFTVTAWARQDSHDASYRAVVSEDSSHSAGFQLQSTPDGHWALAMFQSDVDGGISTDRVVSSMPLVVGRWTQLVGEYDAGAGVLRVYVDGVLGGTVTRASSWHATGNLTIGRSMWMSAPTDYWPGAIDEVSVYQRDLSADEIHALATTPTVEQADYPLDEGAGTMVVDRSGWYRNGALKGGATWTTGDGGGGALHFDGTSGELDTASPAVRTDGSFTVAARVLLDAANGVSQNAVSQDGPSSSGFMLGYRASTGKWTFQVSPADSASPKWVSVDSAAPAQAGQWTWLVAEYDAAAQQLTLYVDTAASSQPATTITTNVSGDVVLGRAKQNGVPVGFLAGSVDDVHLYTGLLTSDQIDQLSVPASVNLYPGELTRWAGVDGGHFITGGPVPPAGYFLEQPLGAFAPAGAAGTQLLYSCRDSGGQFVSTRSDCEGQQVLDTIGPVYASQQADTQPVYRCRISNGDHFVSLDPQCEGTTTEEVLGYTVQRFDLVRYVQHGPDDRASSIGWMPASYQAEGTFGLMAWVNEPGTVPVFACQSGTDRYLSLRTACDGGQLLQGLGWVWADQPDQPSVQLFECQQATTGERFESTDASCEGQSVLGPLGWLLSAG